MKKLCLIIYTLSLLITGCTHTCKYSTLGELNSKIKDKEAIIVLKDEQELIGKDIKISPDSTFWIDQDTENNKSMITSDISSIITKNRGQGAIEGLGLGILCGGVIGAAIGYGSGDDPYQWDQPIRFTAEDKALILGVGLGGIAGLLGMLSGAAAGSNDKFIINKQYEKIKPISLELSAPLIPNSKINLEVSPPAFQNVYERELSSRGFLVVSEGDADYKFRFSYMADKPKGVLTLTLRIINLSTDKIVGVANFKSDHMEEIYITDIIKEFVNQLCSDMK